jgi:hypothetical protein
MARRHHTPLAGSVIHAILTPASLFARATPRHNVCVARVIWIAIGLAGALSLGIATWLQRRRRRGPDRRRFLRVDFSDRDAP